MATQESEKMNLKMVILCADETVAQILAKGFEAQGFHLAAIGASATDALKLVEEHSPDLLMMEPYLSGMNCDELVALLEQKVRAPLVKFVFSDCKHDLLAERFLSNGGDLFRILPMDYAFTAKQLVDHYQKRVCPHQPEEALSAEDNQKVRAYQEILKKIGMPMTRLGYRYIWYGALMVEKEPWILRNRRRYLYPAIALYFQVSPESVERCVRTAIEKTYELGNLELLNRWFVPRMDNGKESNGEFIARLADLCREEESG